MPQKGYLYHWNSGHPPATAYYLCSVAACGGRVKWENATSKPVISKSHRCPVPGSQRFATLRVKREEQEADRTEPTSHAALCREPTWDSYLKMRFKIMGNDHYEKCFLYPIADNLCFHGLKDVCSIGLLDENDHVVSRLQHPIFLVDGKFEIADGVPLVEAGRKNEVITAVFSNVRTTPNGK